MLFCEICLLLKQWVFQILAVFPNNRHFYQLHIKFGLEYFCITIYITKNKVIHDEKQVTGKIRKIWEKDINK